MVGISATLSFPANGSALLRARATISSPSLSMRRARATTCVPTSVSCTFFGRRSTSLTPRYSSSFLSCAERVGWLTKVRSAALPKCPVSASATRYFRSFRLTIDAVYQNHRNYQLLQWAPGCYRRSLNQNLPEDPSHVSDQY